MRPLLYGASFLTVFIGYVGIAMAGDLPLSSKQNNVETFQLACRDNPKITTIDMNNCIADKVDQIKAIQTRYEEAARNRVASGLDDPASHDHAQKTLDAYDAESKAWGELRVKATDATYTDWEEGSIRNIMSAQREIEIRGLRIHDLWLNWLQYMDSTPSVLPEPKFIDVQ